MNIASCHPQIILLDNCNDIHHRFHFFIKFISNSIPNNTSFALIEIEHLLFDSIPRKNDLISSFVSSFYFFDVNSHKSIAISYFALLSEI